MKTINKNALTWILYDFANTIYSMNVVTMYFPLWITVNLAMEDLWVSAGNSLSMALVAVTMPILGAISDRVRCRMPFLLLYTLLCVAGTFFIGVTGLAKISAVPTVSLALLFFMLANYAYQGGLVFYNALLPEVSTARNIGTISGYGVSFGYFGAIVGLLLVMPFVTGGIGFLGINFSGLSREKVTVAEVDYRAGAYLDSTVSRDGYYEYSLFPSTSGRSDDVQTMKVVTRDSVMVRAGGSRRVVSIFWSVQPDDVQIHAQKTWLIHREKKGWGHVGSFMPTALLFLLFAIPMFVFLKEPQRHSRGLRRLLVEVVMAVLPACLFLPFLMVFPFSFIVVNPLMSGAYVRRLKNYSMPPLSETHWTVLHFTRYAAFVNKHIIRCICGRHAAEFQMSVEGVLMSLANTKEVPGALRFLVSKFFYEEGIQTIIIFMAVYAVKVVGFSSDVVVPFFLVATAAAAIGSFFSGKVTDIIGPKRTLMLVISGWIICILLIIIIQDRTLFWINACCVGIFLGSTWTSARPLLISLVPEKKLGEFFGLYSLSGKAASIVGPLLWGIVVYVFGAYGTVIKYKVAVAMLGALMFLGLMILLKVPDRFTRTSK